MNAPDVSMQDRFTYLKEQLALPPPGRRWRNLAAAWTALSGVVVSIIGFLIFLYSALWREPWFPVVGGVVGMVFFGGPCLTLAYYGNQLDKKHRTPLLNELTRLDDLRAVGLLLTLPEMISSWEQEGPQARCLPEIQQALIRLLPRLQRADAVHLSVRVAHGVMMGPLNAQDRLHALLRDENEELVLAVLLALPRVGTIAALPFVKPLTNEKAAFLTGCRSPRIIDAASQCYTLLAEKAGLEGIPNATLLRAASAPASGDTLLRPTLPVAELASEELLRAHPPQSHS